MYLVDQVLLTDFIKNSWEYALVGKKRVDMSETETETETTLIDYNTGTGSIVSILGVK